MWVGPMSETDRKLDEICRRLDTLIALFKLSNRSSIRDYKTDLAKDEVYEKILELTTEPLSYSELALRVSEALNVAEITVKKKIAELKEMHLLSTQRQGREVFYENTGLLE